MIKKFEEYMDRIENMVFNGVGMQKIKNSLYKVGNEKVMILTSAPKCENYFWGMSESSFSECDKVLFLCINDLCAFVIPKSELANLNLSTDKNGRRTTVIKFDDDTDSWYLTCNRDENGFTQLDIQGYYTSLETKDN